MLLRHPTTHVLSFSCQVLVFLSDLSRDYNYSATFTEFRYALLRPSRYL